MAPNLINTWTRAHTAHLCGSRRTPLPPLRCGPEPYKYVDGSSYCTPLRVPEDTSATSQGWHLRGTKPYKYVDGSSYCTRPRVPEGAHLKPGTSRLQSYLGIIKTGAHIAHLCGSRRAFKTRYLTIAALLRIVKTWTGAHTSPLRMFLDRLHVRAEMGQ